MEINEWNVSSATPDAQPPHGAPSGTTKFGDVDNILREIKAAIARYYQDNSGSVVLSPVAPNYYSATINRQVSAYYDGLRITAQASQTNTGPAFVSVNGLAYKEIKNSDATSLFSGELGGATTSFVYKAWADCFFVTSQRVKEAHPPPGAVMLFWASTAPFGWVQDTTDFWYDRAVLTTSTNAYSGGSWVPSGGSWSFYGVTTDFQGTHSHITSGTTNPASGPSDLINSGSGPAASLAGHYHIVNVSTDAQGLHAHNVYSNASWRPLYSSWLVCIRP